MKQPFKMEWSVQLWRIHLQDNERSQNSNFPFRSIRIVVSIYATANKRQFLTKSSSDFVTMENISDTIGWKSGWDRFEENGAGCIGGFVECSARDCDKHCFINASFTDNICLCSARKTGSSPLIMAIEVINDILNNNHARERDRLMTVATENT